MANKTGTSTNEAYTPRIIGVNGSTRTNGLCSSVLDESLAEAEKFGAKTQRVDLVKKLKTFYDGHKGKYSNIPDKDFKEIAENIYDSDGMIIATPVRWHSPGALTSSFMEKMTSLEMRNYGLEGLVVGCIATQDIEGGWSVVQNMAGPLNQMGATIAPYSLVWYSRPLVNKKEFKWMKKSPKLVGRNVAVMSRMNSILEPDWSGDNDFRTQEAVYEVKLTKTQERARKRKH